VFELKAYLTEQRTKLQRVLPLLIRGATELTTVKRSYEQSLTERFSIVRSIIASHLLSSSDKLAQLFEQYEQRGLAVISQIGEGIGE